MTGALEQGASSAARHWIVCADDFAIDAGTVDAIADLFERGALSATSVLVDAPLWPVAARSLPPAGRGTNASSGRADVGLHLNLTQAFAGRASTVWPLRELILRCLARAIARAPLRASIERQLDAFEDAMGRQPEFVDGHQHVHQLAIVREELVAALLRRYPGKLPWLRSTRPPPGVRDAKARTIGALGDGSLRRLAHASGIRTSSWLLGVYDFQGDAAAYWQRLLGWMRKGPDGSVLMCHPARRAEPGDPIGHARMIEHSALQSAQFRATLAAARIELSSGTCLPGRSVNTP